MSDLITSYVLWTCIDAILTIQRMGRKKPTISPLSFVTLEPQKTVSVLKMPVLYQLPST